MTGTIVRVNEFGLCEVRVEGSEPPRRAGFTLNQLAGYGGQPMKEFGILRGARVELKEDGEGRVKSARLLNAGVHS